jgi:integrase
MPIYPGRRKGTHRVTVWKDGRQHEETVEGSKADALEHEARMRLELGARSRTRQRIAPAFSVFCAEAYEPHARARLGADTWRKVRCYQVATLAEFFGTRRLSELSASLVDAYVAQRLKSVVATSVNNELRVLGTLLRFAREECGYPVPELRIRRVKQTVRRVRAWSSVEVRRLLSASARVDPDFVPMLVFLLNTGCRKGEAIAAPWSWVDPRRRALCVGAYERWAPKSKRPREIPLSAALERTLRSLPRSTRWIFPNVHGERYREFPQKRFTAVTLAAGLKGGPHTCRHTFASMFLAAGGTLYDLSAILGHSATRTTELYAHLLPGHLERARNAVNVDARGRNPGTTLAKKRASA